MTTQIITLQVALQSFGLENQIKTESSRPEKPLRNEILKQKLWALETFLTF